MQQHTTAADVPFGGQPSKDASSASPTEEGQVAFAAFEGGVGGLYDRVSQIVSPAYGGNLHIGLWTAPRENDTLPEAADRMTDMVADQLRLSPGRHLLDVGAGTGTPALRMARRCGVEVTGISLSAKDMARATVLARREGLADRVRFEQADALALPYEDGSFDTACAVESMSHIADRLRALREIQRVMRPGGRLVVGDGVLLDPMGARPDQVRMLCTRLAMHLPPTLDAWHTQLHEAGFTPVDTVDLTDHYRYSQRQLLRLVSEASEAFEQAIGAEVFSDMLAALEQYCGRPEIGYVLLAAERGRVGESS